MENNITENPKAIEELYNLISEMDPRLGRGRSKVYLFFPLEGSLMYQKIATQTDKSGYNPRPTWPKPGLIKSGDPVDLAMTLDFEKHKGLTGIVTKEGKIAKQLRSFYEGEANFIEVEIKGGYKYFAVDNFQEDRTDSLQSKGNHPKFESIRKKFY